MWKTRRKKQLDNQRTSALSHPIFFENRVGHPRGFVVRSVLSPQSSVLLFSHFPLANHPLLRVVFFHLRLSVLIAETRSGSRQLSPTQSSTQN